MLAQAYPLSRVDLHTRGPHTLRSSLKKKELLKQPGPQTDIIRIGGPSTYAQIPQTVSAENAIIETLPDGVFHLLKAKTHRSTE